MPRIRCIIYPNEQFTAWRAEYTKIFRRFSFVGQGSILDFDPAIMLNRPVVRRDFDQATRNAQRNVAQFLNHTPFGLDDLRDYDEILQIARRVKKDLFRFSFSGGLNL